MPLPPGTMLGPYEVLAPIGAGGMGEVYKGRDTRLDRIVAIKVLPAHLAMNAEMRDRFRREATAIANLKHPHICVLYDIGEQNGTQYLVMEYLEGETVSARLVKGPLPLEQVLRYAIEISDALDKAHRQGYTHRDIKPANIMLTKEGSKILDFGLAKLRDNVKLKQQAKQPVALGPDDPTPPKGTPLMASKMSGGGTLEGTILGTLLYMAPEQVEGKVDDIDGRADIFSFGATVYEMLTGKRAFEGKSQASVIAKIMEVDPPLISTLDPPGKTLPPAMDYVVKTCLAKDRDDRWQSATDLCRELKRIRDGGEQAVLTKPAMTGRRWVIPWAVAMILGLAVGAAVWYLKPSDTDAPPMPVHLAMNLPGGDQLGTFDSPVFALSHDGRLMAYVGNRSGSDQIYLRRMDGDQSVALAGTDRAENPFFSPDGQWIIFFADGILKKIAVTGGAPTVLCSAGGHRGATWGPDDFIIFGTSSSGLWQVSSSGGVAKQITRIDRSKGETAHRWPAWIEGAGAVLFTSYRGRGWDDSSIAVLRVDTGEQRTLIEGGTMPMFSGSGHLLYFRAGALLALPFDPVRLQAANSAPLPVAQPVAQSVGALAAGYSISERGILAYLPASPHGSQSRPVWVDRKGVVAPLQLPARLYEGSPAISPDGRRIALTVTSATSEILVYDIQRGSSTRLSSSDTPVWTPEGKRITYRAVRGGFRNIFWVPADGSGPEERLTTSENYQDPSSWSADGKMLFYEENATTTGFDIWALSLDGDRKAKALLQSTASENLPSISPDGHWLAYGSNESGRDEVYVQPFPGPGAKWQVSNGGSTLSRWSPTGKEIFYLNGNSMMVVDVATQPTFTASKPKVLFQSSVDLGGFDVAPDGQHFLMLQQVDPPQPATQINVVLNWFEELKQKVPTDK